jgi:metal-dependent amidase/aminoacylase/carboxypeptidase family protein
VDVVGQAGHAGNTPPALRHDALCAAAELVLETEREMHSEDGLIATVGKLDVSPNVGNVIPGLVTLSYDIRHQDDRIREAAVDRLRRGAAEIAERRSLTCDWRHLHILPGYDLSNDKVDMAIEHFTNIAAEKAENKSGNQFIMYVNTGPDHFLHAKVYADIASGGADYLPIGKSAAPITNPRQQRTKSGIWLPSSNKYPGVGGVRHRVGRKGR